MGKTGPTHPICRPCRAAVALAGAFIASLPALPPADLVTVVENGPSSNRVDMVFLGERYTVDQVGTQKIPCKKAAGPGILIRSPEESRSSPGLPPLP